MPGVARPVGIREANGFGNEWKPGGLPEPNLTEPAGETGFAAHPKDLFSKLIGRAGKTPDYGDTPTDITSSFAALRAAPSQLLQSNLGTRRRT